MSEWYHVIILVLLVVGLAFGLWFAISWGRHVRPHVSLASIDAGGWVYGLVALYTYALFDTLRGNYTPPDTWLQFGTRVALAALLDALLIARAVRWRRLGWVHRSGRRQEERTHHE